MAGTETVPDPPLARAQSKRTPGHGIPFNEESTRYPTGDIEDPRPMKCRSCINMCCAWASFMIWTVVVILLIGTIAFFAFLQSNLPEFRVRRLDLYKLNITTSKTKETLLTLDAEFSVNVTNFNKNIELFYSPMTVDVAIEGFNLGDEDIKGFTQAPQSSKDLKIRQGITKSAVNEDDAKELKWLSDRHEMTVFLTFKGTIQLSSKGTKFSKLPLKVLCIGIEQSVIDQGLSPKCTVKMSPFG